MNKEKLRKYSVVIVVGLVLLGFWQLLSANAKGQNIDPNALYLSDLDPVSQRVGYGSFKKDQPLIENDKDYKQITVNHPVSLKPQAYTKGVFAHADAEIIYDLALPNAQNKTLLRAFAGIQANKDKGRVKFDFYLDDALVATTEAINYRQTKPVILEVKNRRRLKIKIDHLGDKTQDHAVLADAKFVTGDLQDMTQQSALEARVGSQFNLATAPHDQVQRLQMLQAQLLRRVGKMDYHYFVKTPGTEAFTQWLMNDTDALAMSNEAEKPYGTGLGFLTILKELYDYDPTIKTDSLNKKIAMAVATAFSGKVRFWADWAQEVNHISRYRLYRNLSRVEGQLRPIFTKLDTAYLTTAIKAEATDEDILWLREKIKKEHPDLLKSNSSLSNATFRYIRYTDTNRHGDSIHGPHFYGFFPGLAEVIEHGGVCGTVSKFDSVALNAFGVPGILVGQPGHAAVIYLTDHGKWSGNNWISSWGETTANPWSPTIIGANHETSFSHVATDSLAQANYDQARELHDYIHYIDKNDYQTKQAIIAKVIELNPIYLPVYRSWFELLEATNASEYQYLELARKMMDGLYNHPVPLTERLKPIKAKITSRQGLNEYYASYLRAIERIESETGRDSISPAKHRKPIDEARHFLGRFNFSGDKANKIAGANIDTEYSLDNGANWRPIKETDHQLTAEELQQINVDHGLQLRVRGSRWPITLKFNKANRPAVRANDQENFIMGMTSSMEYSYDDGQTWIDYADIRPELSGSVKVLVRVKSAGTTYASDAVELVFQQNDLSADFDFVLKENLSIKHATSDMSERGEGAANLIDGDPNTIWHASYNRADTKPKITLELDQVYPVTGLQYLPRQKGDNGRAELVNVYYASQPKDQLTDQDFTLINQQPLQLNYGNNKRQAIDINFSQSVNAKYIRLEILHGYDHYASAAEVRVRTTRQKANQVFRRSKQRANAANYGRLYDTASTRLKNKYQTLHEAIDRSEDRRKLAEMIEWINKVLDHLRPYPDVAEKFRVLNQQIQQFEQQYREMTEQFAKRRYVKLQPQLPPVVSFEQNDAAMVTDFRQAFAEELSGKVNNYHRLARAYYNLLALPTSVQAKLNTEAASLRAKITAINPDQAAADLFRRQFAEVLNSQDVALLNRRWHQAWATVKLLPAGARQLVAPEVVKLQTLEKRIKADAANSKLILTSMVTEAKDFVDRLEEPEYNQVGALRQTIASADTALATGRSRREYDQLSYDLMMQANTIKYQLKEQVLVERRADYFRQQHETILNKDLLAVSAKDRELHDSSRWTYTRLDNRSRQAVAQDWAQLTSARKLIDQADRSPAALAQAAGRELVANAQSDSQHLRYPESRQAMLAVINQTVINNQTSDAQVTQLRQQLTEISERDRQAAQFEKDVRFTYRRAFRSAPDQISIDQKDRFQLLKAEIDRQAREKRVTFSELKTRVSAILESIERRTPAVNPNQPPQDKDKDESKNLTPTPPLDVRPTESTTKQQIAQKISRQPIQQSVQRLGEAPRLTAPSSSSTNSSQPATSSSANSHSDVIAPDASKKSTELAALVQQSTTQANNFNWPVIISGILAILTLSGVGWWAIVARRRQ